MAALTNVTSITASPDQVTQRGAAPITDTFTVTVDSAVVQGDIVAIVTSGPDAPPASPAYVDCTVAGSGTTATCSVTNDPSRPAGVDTISIFADKNHNKVLDSGEPNVVVHATFSGTPSNIGLLGPNAQATGTCTTFTLSSADSLGDVNPTTKINITVDQPSVGTNTTTGLAFCVPTPNPSSISLPATVPQDASTSIHLAGSRVTGAKGESVSFGLKTLATNAVTIRAFYDANGDGFLTTGEPVTSLNVTVSQGGQNSPTSVVVTPDSGPFFAGGLVTGVISVKNSAGRPVAGASIVGSVSGANANSKIFGPPQTSSALSNDLGQAAFSYPSPNGGSDTITAFADFTTGTPGQADPGEPVGNSTVSIVAAPSGLRLDLTSVGSRAGGTTASSDPTIAENSIIPISQTTETFVAKVTDSTTAQPRAGVVVHFTTAGTSTLSAVNVATDGGGLARVSLTRSSPFPGAYDTVTATLPSAVSSISAEGSTSPPTESAFVLWEARSAGATVTPPGAPPGSQFPASTTGSISLAPAQVTSLPKSNQSVTATVVDQFGAAVANIYTFFSVTGRNLKNSGTGTGALTSNNAGQSTYVYIDSGSGSSNPSATTDAGKNLDTVTAWMDFNNNGTLDPGEPSAATPALRLYSQAAAAIEGGIGAGSPQFPGTTPPFSPVTSDDSATLTIDTTNPPASQTAVPVFFQLRNSDNTSSLVSKHISVISSGVGSLVSSPGAGNTALTGAQDVVIGDDGYVHLNVLSTATGVQTITGSVDGFTKALTITWTNTGAGRVLSVTPATGTIAKGTSLRVSTKVVDVYGNPVAGQLVNATLTGPGQFSTGNTTTSGVTGPDGIYGINVVGVDIGSIAFTATATGAQFGAAANTPTTGAPAGNGTGTATFTVNAPGGADPAKTTLTVSPSGTLEVDTPVTITATLVDSNNAPVVGGSLRFIISGVTSGTSDVITTDSTGRAAFYGTSSAPGDVTVKLSVVNSSGVEQFSKTTTITFVPAQTNPGPVLRQTSDGGVVTLTFQLDPVYDGLSVYFFRKSGITGKVIPLGTGRVNRGVATRTFNARTGQILALYGKVIGADSIDTPYSNLVAFKVQ